MWEKVSKQLTPKVFQTSSGCFPRITGRLLIYSLSLTLSVHLASHLCAGGTGMTYMALPLGRAQFNEKGRTPGDARGTCIDGDSHRKFVSKGC